MSNRNPGRSRRSLAGWLVIPAILGLLLLGSGQALALTDAEKYGTVAIIDADAGTEVIVDGEPHVCNFSFVFDLGIEAPVVGWKVKVWDAAPLEGETVLKGSGGPTDADGVIQLPTSGALTAPDGRYNVVWDDEDPPDGSNGARSFVVDCSVEEPPAEEPPAEEPPAEEPPVDLPVGGVDPGLDLGVGGGGGGGITPPPTDTEPTLAATTDNGLVAVAISLLAMTTLIFATSWQRLSARTARR
jgi:hypothetical protein